MLTNDSTSAPIGPVLLGEGCHTWLQPTTYVGGVVIPTTTAGANPIGSPAPYPAVGVPVIPSTTVPPGAGQQLELPFPLLPPPLNQNPPKCERCGKRVCLEPERPDFFNAGRPRRICSDCLEKDLMGVVIDGKYPVTADDMRRFITLSDKRMNGEEEPPPKFAKIDVSTTTDHTGVAESMPASEPAKRNEPEPMEDIVPGMRVWSKSTGKGPYIVLAYNARSEIGPDRGKTITDGWMVRDAKGNDFSMPAADATEREPTRTENPSVGKIAFGLLIYLMCAASVMLLVTLLAKRL